MTVLLVCLMAYQVTGEALHEWFGIGMTVLVIVHQILNRKWYSALFQGRYLNNRKRNETRESDASSRCIRLFIEEAPWHD